MLEGEPATQLAGIAFPHVDLAAATAALLAPDAPAQPWRLLNTYSFSLMRTDAAYAATLRSPGVNLADGKPVTWALNRVSRRARSATSPGHVRGPSLFVRALDEGRRTNVSHYLLGGTPEALSLLERAVAERFPGVLIAGAESPPFRPLTDAERAAQDERIRRSGADLVWVGLGTPQQDVEATRLAAAVDRPAVAIGAAFDFVAGSRPEAPEWVQRLTLEWLFRLASEPRRLWRRYTIGIVRFCLVVAGDLVRPRAALPPDRSSVRDHPGSQPRE